METNIQLIKDELEGLHNLKNNLKNTIEWRRFTRSCESKTDKGEDVEAS